MSNHNYQSHFKQLNDEMFTLLCEFDRFCKKYDIKYHLAYGTLLGAVRHKDFIPWDDDMDMYITPDELQKVIEHKDDFSDGFELVLPDSYGDNIYYDNVARLIYKKVIVKGDTPKQRYYKGYKRYLGLDLFVIVPQPDGIKGFINNFKLSFLYASANAFRYDLVLPHYSPFMKIAVNIAYPIGRILGIKRIRRAIDQCIVKYKDIKAERVHETNDTLECLYLYYMSADFDKTIYLPIRDRVFPAPAGYDDILNCVYGDYMQLPPKDKRKWHYAEHKSFKIID